MERDAHLWGETDSAAAVKPGEQIFSCDEQQDGKTLYLIFVGSRQFM